jgi:hypothetical protein
MNKGFNPNAQDIASAQKILDSLVTPNSNISKERELAESMSKISNS